MEEERNVEMCTIPTEDKNEPTQDNNEPTQDKNEAKKPFWHINKVMLRFKAHFFLFYGAVGLTNPYLPILANERLGISVTSIAATITTARLLSILLKPAIGFVVDYYNKLKQIIYLLIIVKTVLYLLLLAIPNVKQYPKTYYVPQNSKQLNINNQDFKFTVLTIKSPCQYCEHTSLQGISLRANNTEGTTISFNGKNKTDITCIAQFNTTEFICNQQFINEENDETIFKSEMNRCCSVISSQLEIYKNTLKVDPERDLFSLSFVKPNFPVQNLNITFNCSVKFNKGVNSSSFFPVSVIGDFKTIGYWSFFFVIIIAGNCFGGIATLTDTACCESVVKYKQDFGRQKMFGMIGFGVLSPITGLLYGATNDYLAAWILTTVVELVCLWNIFKMDLAKPHFAKNILKNIGTVLKSAEFIAFELGIFMTGLSFGVLWFNLLLYLRTLGASTFLCGLVQYVQCFSALPFIFFSGWFLRKLGHFNLVSLILVSYAVRFMGYSYLQNPWLVLPIEILGGFTEGNFYPVMASFGKLRSKPGTEATTQSIIQVTYDGLGVGVGCVIAGISFDYYGGQWMFFYSSLFAFCATIINVINTILLNRKQTKMLHSTETKTKK